MSKCKDCRFGWYYDLGHYTACGYITITGELRGCPADDCTKFEPKTEHIFRLPKNNKKEVKSMARGRILTEEQKRSIVTESQAGAKVGELAVKYDVSKPYIFKILSNYKEHGERAFSEPAADEETKAQTVDTEKEPETAATETGSKQETCEDIPADIIPETEENVKPPHDFSPLAASILWDKIEDLRQEAADLVESEHAVEMIIKNCKDKLRCIDEQLINVEAELDILMGDYEAVVGGVTV